MLNVFEVFLGGGIGAVCRYLLSRTINYHFAGKFPSGTFIVNMLGCLAVGFLFQSINCNLVPKRLQLVLVTGFLGGFTTFSSFGLESVNLFRGRQFSAGLENVLLSVVIGLVCVAAGMYAADFFHEA